MQVGDGPSTIAALVVILVVFVLGEAVSVGSMRGHPRVVRLPSTLFLLIGNLPLTDLIVRLGLVGGSGRGALRVVAVIQSIVLVVVRAAPGVGMVCRSSDGRRNLPLGFVLYPSDVRRDCGGMADGNVEGYGGRLGR